MKEGYIKIHRKIMDSTVWKNPTTITVWLWCLLKANHKECKFSFNGKDIELKPGEFVTGIDKGAKETRASVSAHRTAIAYLKSSNRIATQSTNQFTIIRIEKWNEYQQKIANEIANDIANQLTENSKRPTNEIATDKNEFKNDKNEDMSAFAEFSSNSANKKDSHVKELIDYFYKSVLGAKGFKVKISGADGSQLKRLLNGKDPLSLEEIKNIMAWYIKTEGFVKYPTIKAALTGHSISLYREQSSKRAWQET